ncbi:MAG: hypothetical protein IT435_06055 [Phycisphaerales bacterium]|nr:hypothetical protein [Phycisphaerales bacterium]
MAFGKITDYTFAVRDGNDLVPIAKAYSGLSNEEITTLDTWIRQHTIERHGPVRIVEPTHTETHHLPCDDAPDLSPISQLIPSASLCVLRALRVLFSNAPCLIPSPTTTSCPFTTCNPHAPEPLLDGPPTVDSHSLRLFVSPSRRLSSQ